MATASALPATFAATTLLLLGLLLSLLHLLSLLLSLLLHLLKRLSECLRLTLGHGSSPLHSGGAFGAGSER
jgi:hypothetical protein